jgi:hypothetical protein
MRKRLVIAVVGLLLLIMVFLLAMPRRNSIEYHVRAYREAERRLTAKETVMDEVKDTLRKIRSQRPGRQGRLRNDMREHKQELIRLGYLEDRTFDATNVTVAELAAAVQKAFLKNGTNYEFFSAATVGTTAVYAISAKGMMPDWTQVTRELNAAVKDSNEVAEKDQAGIIRGAPKPR